VVCFKTISYKRDETYSSGYCLGFSPNSLLISQSSKLFSEDIWKTITTAKINIFSKIKFLLQKKAVLNLRQPSLINNLYYSFAVANKNSLFIRAMCAIEIPLGHSTSQAPVLVQLPNPNSSILATIAFALLEASTLPCGNKAN